ncbi:D-Ala-D-Ala carboxypeptidase family metallohydrolase [Prevotella pallens]|uniref:D-Ala-D-Ala carboxypeptidase family metallohydrolase n=1 Tax=Prevotella pallens TaxID=60133 RepID=UPI001CB4DB08|nr:D-Ala-D-Ala carboxypeptidase family metallohydrolase [Prevotella pallens]MBF1517236.1 peptidase M15A [Prevotella pallens]
MANFTIGEMCASKVAQEKGIDNTPPAMVRVHLTETITLLEAIRAEWAKYCEQYNLGTPSLIVSSGYRSPALNKAVGGVKNSSHVLGYAADVVPANGKQDEFERFMAEVFEKKGYAYDQIIVERSKSARWVHIGYKKADGSQRRQCFKLNV